MKVRKQKLLWLAALLMVSGASLFSAVAQAPPPFPPEVLTNAAQLRALPATAAARQLPVKLRATVTASNPSSIFLQDDTGGTFINFKSPPPAIDPGTVIEVEGVTYVGRFVTGIGSARFSVIGHGTLPPAVPVRFDDLLSARRHYERVEVNGIVRSVVRVSEFERFVLRVALGARKLEVQIAAVGVTNLPPLVDARVRIAGLAAGYINERRQLVAPQLLVSRLEDLQVEVPPLADPFSVPLTDASALLNFNLEGVSSHRARVHGVVTHQQPGEAIYLRDGGYGLLVETAQAGAVHAGDVVEVVGFPAMGRFSAFLEDAEFRVAGREADPPPIPTTLTEVLAGTNDANLITLDAQLIEVLENPAESVLVLRSEDTAFHARMPRTPLALRNGSQLRLVGVCRLGAPGFSGSNFQASPRTIELLLRSPADVAVLAAPSGWTAQRLAVAAGILLGVALAAIAWIAMLRRRLAEQAEVIREKISREAALEERHRMAREMHDTLAQSFSGLGFQLDALNAQLPPDSATVRLQLETARQMVRHGQEGFRRSLLNLRAQELERGSLSEALPELARQITAGTGIEMRCDVPSPPRGLPEAVEANLLRIGQECLANAVHHGQPRHIDLALNHEPGLVRLRIADDGTGFDPEQLKQASNGHFGWRGICERAGQIGACVELHSQPGQGTAITVTVPL